MHNTASASDRQQPAWCRLAPLAAVLGMLLMRPGLARADDWGCQVMLCLSNPGGPEQYAECVPPIEKLWAALRHGDPFPTCDLSEDGSHSTSAIDTFASSDYCRKDLRYWGSAQPSELLCRVSGAINVKIDNPLSTRVWWGVEKSGPTIAEFYGVGSTQVPYDPAQSPVHFLRHLEQRADRFDGGN